MSEMEEDASDFLKRIVWSISAVIVYMLINISFGIYFGWLFFYETPTTGNYIFYGWFVISTVIFIRLLIKWWKKKFPIH